MIDLGNLPRVIQSAVFDACEIADNELSQKAQEMIIDTAGETTLKQWAATIGILSNTGLSAYETEELRAEIYSRLNANGSVNVEWFYRLAQRLGFNPDKNMKVEFDPENKNLARWYWTDNVECPVIHICDGHFLPFRSGISAVGDIVYDNINYGATTVCVIFSEAGESANNALINLFLLSRNLGTKMLFYKEKNLL